MRTFLFGCGCLSVVNVDCHATLDVSNAVQNSLYSVQHASKGPLQCEPGSRLPAPSLRASVLSRSPEPRALLRPSQTFDLPSTRSPLFPCAEGIIRLQSPCPGLSLCYSLSDAPTPDSVCSPVAVRRASPRCL